jgi:hypothetical protein
MVMVFDLDQYHQRNKVKTVFSVLKRKFGESLKARKYRLQIKEIKIKVILYNLSRLMKSFSVLNLMVRYSTEPNSIFTLQLVPKDDIVNKFR